MIKTLLLFLIASFISVSLYAEDATRTWEQGKLTWDDFGIKEKTNKPTQFTYFLGFEKEDEAYPTAGLRRMKTKAFMDRLRSWVNPDFKSEQYLRYNQVLFDFVEIARRQLQHDLDTAETEAECNRLLRLKEQALNKELLSFVNESDYGRKVEITEKWEEKASNLLIQNPNPGLPDIIHNPFKFGMSVGLGSGLLTGSLGNHFQTPFITSLSMQLVYDKIYLLGGGEIGFKGKEKDYVPEYFFSDKNNIDLEIGYVCAGYSYNLDSSIIMVPVAGATFSHFSSFGGNAGKASVNDVAPLIGVIFDYNMYTKYNITPATFFSEKDRVVQYKIRVQLLATKATMNEDIKGYTINLTVSLNFSMGAIRF